MESRSFFPWVIFPYMHSSNLWTSFLTSSRIMITDRFMREVGMGVVNIFLAVSTIFDTL